MFNNSKEFIFVKYTIDIKFGPIILNRNVSKQTNENVWLSSPLFRHFPFYFYSTYTYKIVCFILKLRPCVGRK